MAKRELSSTLRNLKVTKQLEIPYGNSLTSILCCFFSWKYAIFSCMVPISSGGIPIAAVYSFSIDTNSSCKGRFKGRRSLRRRKKSNLMGISFLPVLLVESGMYLSKRNILN